MNTETVDAKYKKMTETPVKGLILRLSVPTIISNLISTLYNAADTFFVGQISTSASAAVGVALSLQAVIQAIGFFFGQGSGNNMSRRLGAHDEKTAEILASTGRPASRCRRASWSGRRPSGGRSRRPWGRSLRRSFWT